MLNIKALSLRIPDKRANRQTYKQSGQKLYAPDQFGDILKKKKKMQNMNHAPAKGCLTRLR